MMSAENCRERVSPEGPDSGRMLAGDERRKSTRYAPVIRLIEVGWWEGAMFRTATAWLSDISFGGAAVVTNCPLPEGLPLWIFLPTLAETEWVQGRVVGHTIDERRIVRTRLQFAGFCPYGLFKMLVWGIDGPGTAVPRPDREAAGADADLARILDGVGAPTPATTPRPDLGLPLPPSRNAVTARQAARA